MVWSLFQLTQAQEAQQLPGQDDVYNVSNDFCVFVSKSFFPDRPFGALTCGELPMDQKNSGSAS